VRVFITGEHGNLANGLSEALVELGHVTNVTKRSHFESDILSSALDYTIRRFRPDVVVHAAAVVSTEKCDPNPTKAIDVNVKGTYLVAKWCAENAIPMIYFSSTTVYDPDAYNSKDREGHFLIEEGYPIVPQTYYGWTKWFGEELARHTARALAIRPCFIYGGKYDTLSAVCKMIRQVTRNAPDEGPYVIPTITHLLNPEWLKDWMHVSDFSAILARVVVDWVENRDRLVEEYNVTALNINRGDPRPMGEIADLIEKHPLAKRRLRLDWVPNQDYLGNHVCYGTLIRAIYPDWSPKVSIEEGIDREMRYWTECFAQH
jgi:nucleoside-diphosphate-sugar epimerase